MGSRHRYRRFIRKQTGAGLEREFGYSLDTVAVATAAGVRYVNLGWPSLRLTHDGDRGDVRRCRYDGDPQAFKDSREDNLALVEGARNWHEYLRAWVERDDERRERDDERRERDDERRERDDE